MKKTLVKKSESLLNDTLIDVIKNEQIDISIIIPVYNTSVYLKKCLHSLSKQTIKNIEFIVVNDGSTDNSVDIINKYSEKDERIRLINKENEGLSSARNKGIDVAVGKYIGFVDSDDWVEENMFEKLYNLAERNEADIVVCNYNKIYDNNLSYKGLNITDEIIELNKVSKKYYFENYLLPYIHGHEVWNKLYRGDLIKQNNIKFEDTKVINNEDILFNLYLLPKVSKIVTTEGAYYNYIQRSNSLIHKKKNNLIDKYIVLIELFKRKLVYENKEEEFNESLPLIYFNFFENAIRESLMSNCNIKEIKKIIDKCTFNKTYREYLYNLIFKKDLINHYNKVGVSTISKIIFVLFYLLCLIKLKYIAATMLYSYFKILSNIKKEIKEPNLIN